MLWVTARVESTRRTWLWWSESWWWPVGVEIIPDGQTAYVVNNGDGTVTPIDAATNTPGTPIPIGSASQGVAITPAPAPVNTIAPSISGTAQQRQTLTASHGSWTGNPIGYADRWQDCDSAGSSCSDISGATGQTYTLTGADVGHTIEVVETATNARGTSAPVSSAPPAWSSRRRPPHRPIPAHP